MAAGPSAAAMDESANDRASKRQKGETDDSSHTLSTASSTHSSSSLHRSEAAAAPGAGPRRVTFAPVTEIRGTHWNQEDVDQGWYTKDELAVFKEERKALVKTLKKVRFDLSRIDQSVHCLRGYEAYFSIKANKEYKQKRQMVWGAVLQEQARQRYMGRKDGLMMQLVSAHATQWARDTATELGMQDAQVALSIFLEYIQEQQEDDEEPLEDFDGCDLEEDFDSDDGAPIALNWDEALDDSQYSQDDMALPQAQQQPQQQQPVMPPQQQQQQEEESSESEDDCPIALNWDEPLEDGWDDDQLQSTTSTQPQEAASMPLQNIDNNDSFAS